MNQVNNIYLDIIVIVKKNLNPKFNLIILTYIYLIHNNIYL